MILIGVEIIDFIDYNDQIFLDDKYAIIKSPRALNSIYSKPKKCNRLLINRLE